MISGLIPHRYAKALYKHAVATKSTESVYGYMKNVVSAYMADKELQKTISNPFVAPADKRMLMLTMAGDEADDTYKRFVTLVMDHNREEFFFLMALAYRDIYRKENKISQVTVTTAVKMDDAEMKRLHKVVEGCYPDTKFEYREEVRPELIGGFVIDVDSTRLDASISGELEQLRQNLLTSN